MILMPSHVFGAMWVKGMGIKLPEICWRMVVECLLWVILLGEAWVWKKKVWKIQYIFLGVVKNM